jgi:hypothetical protein
MLTGPLSAGTSHENATTIEFRSRSNRLLETVPDRFRQETNQNGKETL